MRLLALALASSIMLACGGSALDEPAVPLTQPSRVCAEPRPGAACLEPADIEHWLGRSDLELLNVTDTPQGKQGAQVLTVAAPDAAGRIVFRVKWRAHTTSHSLNVPFREVAAHAVQKLFLEPHEWVIPPAATTCFSLKSYRTHVDRNAKPPFDGINCVFGVVSYWLEDAHEMDDALDEELFWQSRTYRDSLANVNLMSFLIDHGDSHPAQFLTTGDPSEPRVRLVDNTIAFSDFRNPAIRGEWDWSKLQVPALPRRSVQRLASLDDRDLKRLHVIEQYANQAGRLVRKTPTMRLAASDSGMAWVDGDLVLGLDDAELARLEKRVREVVARVDRGKMRTF